MTNLHIDSDRKFIYPLSKKMFEQYKEYYESDKLLQGIELLSYGVKVDDGSKTELPKTTKKIILSAGHSIKKGEDNGAVGCGLVEGIENAKIRKRVYEILKTKYKTEAIIDDDISILQKSINTFKNLIIKNKYKDSEVIALEIHFNAASDPKANGTETVIPSEYTKFELQLANELSIAISQLLKTRLRGNIENKKGVITEASSRAKRLGWMRIPAQNVLIELCFITNPEETKMYKDNFESICQSIAGVLYQNAL